MISNFAKRTKIYDELSTEMNKRFFDYAGKKFLHNIDSLYYVVKVKNDWNHDEGCQKFVSYLDMAKSKAVRSFDPYVLFQGKALSDLGTSFVMNGIGSAPYQYDIEKVDKYMMFVTGHQLNNKTPEIWVQLRSQNLWLFGEYEAVRESLADVEKILSKFDIEIEEVSENRIDYAYHTNYIQDPLTFFDERKLNKMQKSRFERASKEYKFVGEFDIESDYITLGRKKSNNVFFRIYDKTKEVVEQGYKQFFIKLWYMEKMISYFDFYCLERAFQETSRTKYNYLHVSRLEFYLEHGSDDELKAEIGVLLKAKDKDYDEIRKLADKLVPRVTKVLNIEIETKRKFYYSMDNSVDMLLQLKTKDAPVYAKKLYVKLDNKQVFHNYITCNNEDQQGVIRFLDYNAVNKFGKPWTRKEKFPTANWWARLQAVKVHRKYKVEDVKLLREYQKSLSITLMKKKILNTVTTHSLYLHGDDVQNNTYDDVLDYLATLNETDIEKAREYKKKKMTLLQNRLDSVEGVSKIDKHLRLYDPETGQTY